MISHKEQVSLLRTVYIIAFTLVSSISSAQVVIDTCLTPTEIDHCKLGIENHGKGKYKEAIKNFNQAILLNDEDTVAYFERAKTYVCWKKCSQAIKDIQTAIDYGKRGAEIYLIRAEANDARYLFKEALQDYNQYIELCSRPNKWVYYNKGYAEIKLKKYNDAINSFTNSIELDTLNNLESSYAYMGRAFAYYKKAESLKKEKPKEAKSIINQAKADYVTAKRLENKSAEVFLKKIRKKYGI